MTDVFRMSDVTSKAMLGDEASLLQVFIIVVSTIVVIAIKQILIKRDLQSDSKEKYDALKNQLHEIEKDFIYKIETIEGRMLRAKESHKKEYERIARQCSVKYEALAKQETKHENLKEQVAELQSTLNIHQTSTRFELEKIDTRITSLEVVIQQELIPMVKEGFGKLAELSKDIAVIKEKLHRE